MTITQTFTTPTAAPVKSDTPTVFDAAVDARLAWDATHVTELATWTTQANAEAARMGVIAAGGAMTIPYTFSTTITDADPGAGILRLSSATQNASTVIRADLSGSDASVWTTVLDTFDDSTSIVKGQIKLIKVGDGTKWLLFNVTALASPSGYKNITVTNIGGSAASPFADGDSLILQFTRNGDMGAGLPVATQAEVEAATSNVVGITPLNANWHPGVVKVWIKCNASGTINASLNVTSITDTAVGKVTVTIATDFSNTDYIIVTSCQDSINSRVVGSELTLLGSFGLIVRDAAGTLTDPANFNAVCFGDQT